MIVDGDLRGDPVAALIEYRTLYVRGLADFDTLLNLAVLCFRIGDFGFNVHYRLPFDVIDDANHMRDPVIDRAVAHAEGDRVAEFWKAYFEARDCSEGLATDLVNDILRQTTHADPLLWYLVSGLHVTEAQRAHYVHACVPSSFRRRFLASFLTAHRVPGEPPASKA